MNTLEKAIKLVDFWYSTDFYNFRNNYDGIEEAIHQTKETIEKHLDRIIEIIRQDIDEIEDESFTEEAENIIKILKS